MTEPRFIYVWGEGYVAFFFRMGPFYVKRYIRLKDNYMVWGVSSCTATTPRLFYASIDADKHKLPRRLVESPEVVYYRHYCRDGKCKEHLIMGPYPTKSMAVRKTLGYDDNKHMKVKTASGLCHNWGVIRVTPLPGEVELDLYISRDPLGRLISFLRQLGS